MNPRTEFSDEELREIAIGLDEHAPHCTVVAAFCSEENNIENGHSRGGAFNVVMRRLQESGVTRWQLPKLIGKVIELINLYGTDVELILEQILVFLKLKEPSPEGNQLLKNNSKKKAMMLLDQADHANKKVLESVNGFIQEVRPINGGPDSPTFSATVVSAEDLMKLASNPTPIRSLEQAEELASKCVANPDNQPQRETAPEPTTVEDSAPAPSSDTGGDSGSTDNG